MGQKPTYSHVERQLGIITNFLRGNSFISAYISGAFRAHIAKSPKENPYHHGTLCHLNGGMPIQVGSTQPPMLAARQPSMQIAMIDVTMLPTRDEDTQDVRTMAVPATQMTIAQQRMAQAVWQSIQLARQDQRARPPNYMNLK